MGDRIPEMRGCDFNGTVLKAVGESVSVGVHLTESGSQVNMEPTELLRSMVQTIMHEVGIGYDRDVEGFGLLVAHAAIGKLASAEGFTARFGDFYNPREIVDVNLRPETTKLTEVQATMRGEE